MTDTTDLLQNVSDDDRWLRRMSRRLLRDPHAADDAAQETWLAALRSGTPRGRGWFATVVKNAALQWRRGETARSRRELAVARGEATVDPAASIVERLATQRRVLDAVLGLPESARTVVLLRFFENMPPRAIADRLGEPVATVKTRLHRALERLRVDLDHVHGGDRRAWMIALVPFAMPSAASGAAAGGVIMALSAKWIVIPAAVVLITGVGMFLQREDARGLEPTAPAVKAPAAETGSSSDRADLAQPTRVDAGGTSTRVPAQSELTAPPSVPAATTKIARGLVLDISGQPRANLPLLLTEESGPTRSLDATSDASGRFEFVDPPSYGTVTSADPTVATVFAGVVGVVNTIEPTVVVAPAIRITGLVIDADGAPVPHVTIEVEARRVVEAAIARPLDSTRPVHVSDVSDANGRFELERVPAVPRASLVAKADGFANAVLPLPIAGGEVRFVLSRLIAHENHLVGQVVDRFQIPIEGASIVLLGAGTHSGPDGRFVLSTNDVANAKRQSIALELRVVKSGFLQTIVALDPEHLPPATLVVLDGEPKSIEGFVRTQNGDPVPAVSVSVVDGTPFGVVDDNAMFTEEIARRTTDGMITDASGHFELSGLADRDYVLQVVSSKPVLVVKSSPIRAGSQDVTLLVPDDARVDEVQGVVVGSNGDPLPGVTVAAQVTTREIQVFSTGSIERAADDPTTTDEHGRFVLKEVPRRGLWLEVGGDSVIMDQTEIPTLADPPEPITLVARRRCHFRVELAGEDAKARYVTASDGDGNVLTIGSIRSSQSSWSSSAILDGGKSGVFVLPEHAAKIVLHFEGTRTREIPVTLVPGEVTVITG